MYLEFKDRSVTYIHFLRKHSKVTLSKLNARTISPR